MTRDGRRKLNVMDYISKLYGIPVLILLLFYLVSGCSFQDKTKEQLMSDGIRLVQENKAGEAIISFKKALNKDPNYYEARFQLAKIYCAIGKLEDASKELEKVRRLNPSSREVKIELARVMVQTGKPDDALREVAGYLSADTTDGKVLEIAGWAHALKKDYLVAKTLLKRAVDLSGTRSDASLSLAAVDDLMGNTQDAETELTHISEKEPANIKALYLLADIQLRRKNGKQALQTLDRIIQANPKDINAQYRRGLLYLGNGEYDHALALSQTMIKMFPTRAEGERLKGIVLFAKQQYIEAIAALQKSLMVQPDVSAYYVLGLSLYQKNETEQAINNLQKALEIQPSFAAARIYLSMFLLKKNRVDDAVLEVKKVLDEENNNAFAHNVLGSAYIAKENYAEALAELNKALKIQPGFADAHIKKGLIALQQGKGTEAESELAYAMRLLPEQQDVRRMLALYYINHNEYSKAISVLRDGIRGQQSDAVLYYLIAESFLRQDNVNEAMKHFVKAKETDPKNDLASIKIASIYFLQGKQEQGIQELRNLLDRSPNNLQALLMLASLSELNGNENDARKYFIRAGENGAPEGIAAASKYFQRANDTDLAVKVLKEGMIKWPDNELLCELIGKIQVARKQYKDAIKTFERLERYNYQLGFTYLVRTYLVMGDDTKALERIRAEIEKNPTNLNLRAELSNVYQHMGKTNNAIENAQDIIRQNPKSPRGYLNLALVYQRSNDLDKAIKVLRDVDRKEDADIAFMLGNLFFLKKNYAAALGQYRKAEKIKPGAVPVLFQKGDVFYAMQKKEEAIAEYQKVIRLSPNHVMALNNLAYLYGEENRKLDQALLYATRAFVLAPDNDLIRDTLGYVLVKSGKIDQGLYMLKKAAGDSQKNPNFLYHLALAYNARGDTVGAVENLQKALKIGDFPEAIEAKTLLQKFEKN